MVKKVVFAISIVSISGCATGLNSLQEREYAAFERSGVLIEEKNPNTGVALGFLPGGGSFYAREPGFGILNLLMWPLSILWDPISGQNGAMTINYDLTKFYLKKQKEKEISILDEKLGLGKIKNNEYILAKRKIEQKYTYE